MPRIINVICDAALVFGYAEERYQIDPPLIRDVLGELEITGVLPPAREAGALAVVPETPVPAATSSSTPPEASAIRRASPGPAAAALAHDEAERLSRLTQREEALAQRERELMEQRRVLAEEYRLLRTQRAYAGPAAIRVQVAPEPVATRFASARHDGLLTRIKRTLLGVSPPAVEEN